KGVSFYLQRAAYYCIKNGLCHLIGGFVAQNKTLYFSAWCFWQALNKLHFTWVSMSSQTYFHVLLQIRLQFFTGFVFGVQHHNCFNNFTTLCIWLSYHRRLKYCFVFYQSAFHFKGPHAITRSNNHVICTTNKADAAIFIQLNGVAGEVIFALKSISRHIFIALEPAQGGSLEVHC